jgi:hypothetical protein
MPEPPPDRREVPALLDDTDRLIDQGDHDAALVILTAAVRTLALPLVVGDPTPDPALYDWRRDADAPLYNLRRQVDDHLARGELVAAIRLLAQVLNETVDHTEELLSVVPPEDDHNTSGLHRFGAGGGPT